MTISYFIQENDYLNHQLYIASQSKLIKRKRSRNKLLLPLIYLGLSLMFLKDGKHLLSGAFFLVGLVWFLFYPRLEKIRYIKHYRNHIQENLKTQFSQQVTLEVSDSVIHARDSASESKVNVSEIKEIVEIPETIFIRLQGGQSFIIPASRVHEIDLFRTYLKRLSAKSNVPYKEELNWQWQ